MGPTVGSEVGAEVVGSEAELAEAEALVGEVALAEELELEPGATYGSSVIGSSPEHTEKVDVAVALAQSICVSLDLRQCRLGRVERRPRVDLLRGGTETVRRVERCLEVGDSSGLQVDTLSGVAEAVLLELVVVDFTQRVVGRALRGVNPLVPHLSEQRRLVLGELGGVVRVVLHRVARVAAAHVAVVVVGPQAVDRELAGSALGHADRAVRVRVDVLVRDGAVHADEQVAAELRHEELALARG
ncbi:hypothetical protein ON010_g14735 [Phytophthora cinnamomi]|nr:hypothetical protein ON010_g14735 [Phytophthora cinnamomi]